MESLGAGVSARYASGTPAVVPARCNGRGRTTNAKGNTMRKTKEASWTLLAIGLVLWLVGMRTGWTEAISGWAAGHIVEMIPGYAERAQ